VLLLVSIAMKEVGYVLLDRDLIRAMVRAKRYGTQRIYDYNSSFYVTLLVLPFVPGGFGAAGLTFGGRSFCIDWSC
jgi:hypothetical protein